MKRDDEIAAGESWLLVLILMAFSVACFGALLGA